MKKLGTCKVYKSDQKVMGKFGSNQLILSLNKIIVRDPYKARSLSSEH